MGKKLNNLQTFKINTAIYVRVSTSEQDKTGFSPDGQIKSCRDIITAKGLTEVKVYLDTPCSGTVPYENRKGFSELLEDIKKGLINVVTFQMFDRLARTNELAYSLVTLFKKYNIRMIECQNNLDSLNNPMFETIMGFKFLFAQSEHAMIRERSMNGTASKMRKLGWVGKRVPFGYEKPNKNKDSIPVVNDSEGKVIRLVYKLYWNDEMTLQGIVSYLNNNKYEASKYSTDGWKVNAVLRVLKDHRDKYEGGLINDNENGIRWGKILDIVYPIYPRKR